MADTYPCPTRVPRPTLNCLDKNWIKEQIYTRIETIAARVQAFQLLMLTPASELLPDYIRPPDEYPCVDCDFCNTGKPPSDPANIQPGEFYGIAAYIDMMFATGYVVKQVKYRDETLWKLPPDTKEEVELLQECQAFWGSWGEVYGCMSLNAKARDSLFGSDCGSGDCMRSPMWEDLYLSLDCLAYYRCYPSCQCIYCDPRSCLPCNKCLSLQVEFENYWALEDVAGTGATGSCALDFTVVGAEFKNLEGVAIENLSLNATAHLVKSHVVWSIAIIDARQPTVLTLTHQVEMDYTGVEGPSNPCIEIPEPGMLVNTKLVELYYHDLEVDPAQTHLAGVAYVTMQLGFPICARPWNGVKRYYMLDLLTVPECPDCPSSIQPATDGMLKNFYGYMELKILNVSYLGREFYAKVIFDDEICAFRLSIGCVSGGEVWWEGIKLTGCGGPQGVYGLDPDFLTNYNREPCFSSAVRILP